MDIKKRYVFILYLRRCLFLLLLFSPDMFDMIPIKIHARLGIRSAPGLPREP